MQAEKQDTADGIKNTGYRGAKRLMKGWWVKHGAEGELLGAMFTSMGSAGQRPVQAAAHSRAFQQSGGAFEERLVKMSEV